MEIQLFALWMTLDLDSIYLARPLRWYATPWHPCGSPCTFFTSFCITKNCLTCMEFVLDEIVYHFVGNHVFRFFTSGSEIQNFTPSSTKRRLTVAKCTDHSERVTLLHMWKIHELDNLLLPSTFYRQTRAFTIGHPRLLGESSIMKLSFMSFMESFIVLWWSWDVYDEVGGLWEMF